MKRIIFHIDVNSAFLSWSAVKLLEEGKEDIRLVPSVVSGDPNKRTSVVLAKSIPAKAYGINTGEPIGMALRKCPDIKIAKPDFSLYSAYSRAFMKICSEYTPVLEKFSIDECFLDMSGMERVYPDIIKTAYEIKDRIKNELGFTVNVGVGSNKLLAKMASDFEKPDRVHTLFDYEVEEKMWRLPVRDLIFLGRASAEKLERLSIKTIGELAGTDIQILKATLGNKAGEQMKRFANGIDDSPVEENRRAAKSYGHSITLEEDLKDREKAYNLLLALSDASASRMRADGLKAYCVTVNIRNNKFKNTSHQQKSDSPTDVTNTVYNTAKKLFDELWDGSPLRLIGVSLSDVTAEEGSQLSMFVSGDEAESKKHKIDTAMDNIRTKYGSSKISHASTLNTRKPKKK